jgi:hypothetical protein
MNKYIKKIFKKMCKYSNLNYRKINFYELGWYKNYSWTEDQKNKFENWFYKFLKRNKNARKNLMFISIKKDSFIKNYINTFPIKFKVNNNNENRNNWFFKFWRKK